MNASNISSPPGLDIKSALVIVATTILPMIDYYGHSIVGVKAYDRAILYLLVPLLLILLLFRQRPADYGFVLGDWKRGLLYSAGAILIMAIVLLYVARLPAMQSFYSSRAPDSIAYMLYINAVELIGWEFLWRGLLLFALARLVGPSTAILLQAVPFALFHLGKPEIETLSTLFGGAALGYIAWKSRSFLYPWLIHWFVTSFTMLVASGRI